MRLPPKLKKFVIVSFVTVSLLGLFLQAWRVSLSRSGSRQLDAVTARLDTTEPGWRLEEIEAARLRAAPPDDRNPSTAIRSIHGTLPEEWKTFRQGQSGDGGAYSNQHPAFREFVWLATGRAFTLPQRDGARAALLRPELLASPGGFYPVAIGINPLTALLPHADQVRTVASLLEYDARLAALEGDPDRAIQSARAGLVVARSIGEEPFLISQLVRIACTRIAMQSGMQALAWDEPTAGLAELQKELRTEADFPWFQVGIRGERAILHRLFDSLESGKIGADEMAIIGFAQPGVATTAGNRLYRPLLPGDHAKALEILTQYHAAATLPPHEQKAALAKITLPPRPPESFRYVYTILLIPACDKVAEAGIRNRAGLLSASVAIACERYRRANGRWPESLAAIPREILPEVPLDPYTGGPIQFRRLPDGIAIFADDDEEVNRRRRHDAKDPIADLGEGWKLWNPDHRGVTAAVRLPDVTPDEMP